ncbi:MAG: hypothetical protein ACI92S_005345, partial [Planctomycetaceae bacterium]
MWHFVILVFSLQVSSRRSRNSVREGVLRNGRR